MRARHLDDVAVVVNELGLLALDELLEELDEHLYVGVRVGGQVKREARLLLACCHVCFRYFYYLLLLPAYYLLILLTSSYLVRGEELHRLAVAIHG